MSKLFRRPFSSASGNNNLFVVLNSCSKSKTPLKVSNSKFLSWYSCGPTVYDSAHVGHARFVILFSKNYPLSIQYFKLEHMFAKILLEGY